MNYKHHRDERGYIALISILILSAVLLVTTLSLAQFGIASRYFILDLEYKTVSEKLAEGCVHIARIRAYNDPTYEVNSPTTIAIGDGTCTFESVSPSGDETTIEVSNTSGNAVTNYEVVVDNTNGDFLSWEEKP
jgi:hypothetical protein